MKKILNSAVIVFVIIIVLLLIIPLPAFMLDVMIIINISLSMIILLITMNVKEPLEFSIFPSLLLVTTLLRLGLNVSSTRNILSNQGSAGAVIKSFGDFVLQGNVVVGCIIFLIIVLVNFLVITKGTERVSEVAARFTLDAMPGKQMAIDADLSSGLISEQEAKLRRSKVQREADFYGAMDGATKFVKGDAIISLVITGINFVGGAIIGMVQADMPLSEVMSVYSIATVGDGLVSQIPSLLIATATGMIVTRAVSEGSLSEDVSKQFLDQPRAIMVTGGVLVVLMLVPGMPKLQLGFMAILFVAGGEYLVRKIKQGAEPQLSDVLAEAASAREEAAGGDADETEYFRDVNNVYSLIGVEAVEMEFGYSLIPLVDESNGGKMINRIVIFRRQYAQEMGLVIPSIRLRDSSSLNTNQYVIKIKGEEVAQGEILVDYYLALEPSEPLGVIDGIETVEPAYGIPSKWIRAENKEMAEIYGYTVIDPLSVMVTHLSETIKIHAYELLNRQEVKQLVETVKARSPELVDEIFPNVISYGNLQKILTNLIKEGIPIKDMETILETITDSAGTGRDTDMVTEDIRVAFKRTITRKFCEGGQMRVVTLEEGLEKAMIGSITKSSQGVYLALSPEIMQVMITQIGEYVKKFNDLSQTPVMLVSQVVRVYCYRLIEPFYPTVRVLSFNEIANNVQIQAIGTISMNTENAT